MKKYCPKCKNEVTVIKNGNRRGKQCYICKCGKQLIDRKYPIEVQSLAVLIYRYMDKKSYRYVAKIFGAMPNTIRNWAKSNIDYEIVEKAQKIETLKDYKSQCENVKLLNDKIEQLDKSLKYWQYEEQINEWQRELVKPNCYERNRNAIKKEISRIYDEIKKLGEIKYNNCSTEKIRKSLLETEKKLKKQIEIKKEKEAQCVYARENYDIDKIIEFLEKICT